MANSEPGGKNESTLLGAAGEHYVMSELLRRGYIACLAPQGVPSSDIVVTTVDGSRLCSVQVKSRSGKGADGGWHMRPKHERLSSPQLFYCFVDFGLDPGLKPIVYVVPSSDVATFIRTTHGYWLSIPGVRGQPHKDNPVRRLIPDCGNLYKGTENPYPAGWLDTYRDGWQRLPLDPKAAGILNAESP